MGVLRLRVLAICAIAAGCYSPKIQNGSILCDTASGCPEGFECVEGACWRDGTAPGEPDADPFAPDADPLFADAHPAGCVDSQAPALAVQWANQIGGAGLEETYKIDARDTFVATGGDFDSDPFGTGGSPLAPVGLFDAFVVEYNDDASHVFTKHIAPQTGGDKFLATRDVAIDSAGGVVATGYFESRTDFGGTSVNSGLYSAFVARYDQSGGLTWLETYISDFGFDTEGLAIAVNADDEVFVTGWFDELIDFDGTDVAPTDVQDAFVVKLSADGQHQWHAVFSGAGAQQGAGIATDGDGNPIVVGTFDSEILFPGAEVETGVEEGFAVKLDKTDGSVIWHQIYRGSGTDLAEDVAVSGANIYVCGTFASDLAVDGQTITSGGTTAWLAQLDGDGNAQWAREVASTLNTSCQGMSADSQGPVIGGDFTGQLRVGPGAMASTGDAYVAAFDTQGCATSVAHFEGTPDLSEAVVDVAATDAGVYVTGTFSGTVTFGATQLVSPSSLLDIFVSKLTRP